MCTFQSNKRIKNDEKLNPFNTAFLYVIKSVFILPDNIRFVYPYKDDYRNIFYPRERLPAIDE